MENKIKNLEKVAERIKKAVLNKERIILYGDSDLDGISSVVILEETIKNLGGEISAVFFPDREVDGYGVNAKALDILKDKAPALFITLDLGIGNVKEVEIAKKLGFEVIIIDHHETLNGIPDTPLIIDPKQKDDNYSFKGLANVGVTFRLCEEILSDKISENLRNSLLELAALGTISDMVPQTDENQKIIEEGLRSLKNTFRPALRAFLDILGEGYVFQGALQKIISAL
ncbi:MAG: DHH family phosphoesterase, partial [Candidatus Staskawiczbacteria bacterium]|nr:DHH family phosphoesterase [Candidatus Staskawiczbacteria bacterium]